MSAAEQGSVMRTNQELLERIREQHSAFVQLQTVNAALQRWFWILLGTSIGSLTIAGIAMAMLFKKGCL